MRGSSWLLTLALVASGFGFSAAPASASGTPLHLCNHSEYRIDVAIGYHSSGPDDTGNMLTGPFVSRGWFIIEPGNCISIDNPFAARYMYWTGFRKGAFLWDTADSHFCIPTGTPAPRFTFERQNESEDACVSATPLGPTANMWIATREVDVSVDPDVDFDGH